MMERTITLTWEQATELLDYLDAARYGMAERGESTGDIEAFTAMVNDQLVRITVVDVRSGIWSASTATGMSVSEDGSEIRYPDPRLTPRVSFVIDEAAHS